MRDWYESLGCPKHVVAPMVDASELAWRILCRRHGAHLCYTPMLHSNVFVRDAKYRQENLATCSEDRPLIVQFCGNDPEIMAAAAKHVAPMCDAIDINLGCPQAIAKRGHYGSFLQEEWALLEEIIKCMSQCVNTPITCKIRIFDDVNKTIKYAQMLQNAGCKLLTVHGRTREQKGPLTGLANWDFIKAVKLAVNIPVLANGNIQYLGDVYRCMNYTGANGVMSAEGILTNPALFEGINPLTWEIAEEYLDLVEIYPCPNSFVRGHLFKIFHKIFLLQENNESRELLATGRSLDEFRTVCKNIKSKYEPYHKGEKVFESMRSDQNLILPPWICQPYVRMSPEEHIRKMEHHVEIQNSNYTKRVSEVSDGGEQISRKRLKKLRRIMRRPPKTDSQKPRPTIICHNDTCCNPLGGKCGNNLCKQCCRNKCYAEDLDCEGHRILVFTRKAMAKKFALLDKEKPDNVINELI